MVSGASGWLYGHLGCLHCLEDFADQETLSLSVQGPGCHREQVLEKTSSLISACKGRFGNSGVSLSIRPWRMTSLMSWVTLSHYSLWSGYPFYKNSPNSKYWEACTSPCGLVMNGLSVARSSVLCYVRGIIMTWYFLFSSYSHCAWRGKCEQHFFFSFLEVAG